MLQNVDLWSEMDRLRRRMDSLFSNFERVTSPRSYPLINVYDGKDEILVTAELPGMDKEKMSITFSDGVLTLSGKVEPLSSAKNMTVIRQERSLGDFEKTIRIPTKINQEKISATFTNGILSVTLPKSEEARPKTIQIEAK